MVYSVLELLFGKHSPTTFSRGRKVSCFPAFADLSQSNISPKNCVAIRKFEQQQIFFEKGREDKGRPPDPVKIEEDSESSVDPFEK